MDTKLISTVFGLGLSFCSVNVVFAEPQCPSSAYWVSSCNTVMDTKNCTSYWQGSMMTSNTKTCKHATKYGVPYCTGGSACYELYPDSDTKSTAKKPLPKSSDSVTEPRTRGTFLQEKRSAIVPN